jgi:regulator of cell morphogenesis and NO signaling
MNLNSTKKIGELVAEKSALAESFEKLGIDCCCGGDRTWPEVCAEKGIAANALMRTVAENESGPSGSSIVSVKGLCLRELVDHIELAHHRFLRTEVPRIQQLMAEGTSVDEIKGMCDLHS